MAKVLLFDGNSIINRAFYAMPPLANKKGIYTNGVYGFMNIFYRFVNEENPDFVGVAFDLHAPTFRHKRFDAYKGTRKSMPEELRPQIPLLKELLAAMGVKTYELEGFEADDLLGTLAKKAEAAGDSAVVVSGDRDLLQIATDRIKIRIPKTKAGKTEVEDYFAKDVEEKYGVTPTQFIDVKALMGDASDNIPGVTSIGEKTAAKIIIEYGDIETAIENAAQVKPKRASEALAAEQEIARLSKELATIVTDAPVALDGAEYSAEPPAEGLAMMAELGFKNLLGRVGGKVAEKSSAQETKSTQHFQRVTDIAGFVADLLRQTLVAYEVFTYEGTIEGFSFAWAAEEAYWLEIESPLSENTILEQVRPFFESERIQKIAIDTKRTYKILDAYEISVRNVVFDVHVAGYVLNPTMKDYAFDTLAAEYLEEEIPAEQDILGKGKSKIGLLQLAETERALYAARIAAIAYRLYPVLDGLLAENEQTELYYQMEKPLTEILFDMEKQGIRIDGEALSQFGQTLSGRIDKLTAVIYELAGKPFNINSPKQLGEILFEDLGLTSLKKTKTGYSTNIEELERLKFDHPIIAQIIEYRSLTKLKSTYVDGLTAVMNPRTSKLHTTFNQTVTATGRLSSTDPNLQNIPIRLELGRELRKVFIPDDAQYTFVDADYSQIELRVLAHVSGDETLIQAFQSGQDIHRLTASQVNNMPYELITPGQRSAAKAVNFGIIYGISAFSLSVDLGITKKEADKYINAYFQAYPKIKQYLDTSIAQAKEKGYAQTIFNRRRPMPELKSANFNMRSFGERVAMNMPIQGSAADIIKLAMIRVHRALAAQAPKSKMLLQVHDELLIMAHRDEAALVQNILQTEMEGAAELLVRLEVDIHSGETWYDAK